LSHNKYYWRKKTPHFLQNEYLPIIISAKAYPKPSSSSQALPSAFKAGHVKGLAGGADQIQLVVLIPPFKLFRRVTDLYCTGIMSSGNGTLLIFYHSISLSLE
jgi:hypothetical protein